MNNPTQLIEQLVAALEDAHTKLDHFQDRKAQKAALTAARAHLEQPEPSMAVGQLYEARFKRLVAMEASLAPEDRIAYYVRNPHELDRLIKLDELAKDRP